MTLSALKCGAFFVLAAILIGELVSPYSETLAQQVKAKALHRNIDQGTSFGLWFRDGDTYVNVSEVMPNLSLRKIKIFQFAGHDRLHSLVDAEVANFVAGAWQMSNVNTTIIDDEGFVQMTNVVRQAWQTTVTQEMMKMFVVQPAQLSMAQLRTYIDHLARNHQDARASELAYWSKWMLPVSTAVMVFPRHSICPWKYSIRHHGAESIFWEFNGFGVFLFQPSVWVRSVGSWCAAIAWSHATIGDVFGHCDDDVSAGSVITLWLRHFTTPTTQAREYTRVRGWHPRDSKDCIDSQ
ncbi:MAG: hypothetical protein CM1200mP41_07370 [Gammaproteobacteria bacterium]|nr:MAG: hypothetical protein CM1200mP41_07370 [Gammaproteobacteria bacterium]